MNDAEKDKRILFMLKLWFYLTEKNICWESVKDFLERKINEEFE